MQYKTIFLLFLGHLMTDISQGAVPALLPYFIGEYNLTYSAAGFLILSLTVSSSVMQPLFGYLADRRPLPWFIALGPFLAGLGLAIAVNFHNYYVIVVGVFLCGLGVAAFHPEGARMAGIASGSNKASGMSVFSVGGNAGFALGPVVVSTLILFWGLKGVAFYFFPAFLTAIILFRGSYSRRFPASCDTANNNGGSSELKVKAADDAWVPFILLTAAIVCRSVLFQGINTFLPSYWVEVFNASKEGAGTVLTILLGSGVVGNLAGGRLADRFGNKYTVLAGFIILIPQLLLFVNLSNPLYATILLMTIGFTSFVSFSPMIVMGQQYLPNRVGFASGITIGLAVSAGGFAAPLIGSFADFAGVRAVFHLLPLFPVLTVLFVCFLPKFVAKRAATG